VSKVLLSHVNPKGGADISFFSSQPDTRLHHERPRGSRADSDGIVTVYQLVCTPVYSPAFAGTHFAYPRIDSQAELTWVTYRDGLTPADGYPSQH